MSRKRICNWVLQFCNLVALHKVNRCLLSRRQDRPPLRRVCRIILESRMSNDISNEEVQLPASRTLRPRYQRECSSSSQQCPFQRRRRADRGSGRFAIGRAVNYAFFHITLGIIYCSGCRICRGPQHVWLGNWSCPTTPSARFGALG